MISILKLTDFLAGACYGYLVGQVMQNSHAGYPEIPRFH